VAQTPTGALTDRLRHKRWMIVAAAAVVAVGCLWIVAQPTLIGVLAAQVLIGSTATIFPASIATCFRAQLTISSNRQAVIGWR